jgi:uncharacterized protein (DUF2267 family)
MNDQLDVLETTVQKTYSWISDVMDEAGLTDRHKAYLALRAVLHALRDRLTIEEASHLSAELPLLVRGLYFEGWRPSEVPARDRTEDEFLSRISRNLPFGGADFELKTIAPAVYRVIARHVSEGETRDVLNILPPDLRELLAHRAN